jgi:hypothetical protein
MPGGTATAEGTGPASRCYPPGSATGKRRRYGSPGAPAAGGRAVASLILVLGRMGCFSGRTGRPWRRPQSFGALGGALADQSGSFSRTKARSRSRPARPSSSSRSRKSPTTNPHRHRPGRVAGPRHPRSQPRDLDPQTGTDRHHAFLMGLTGLMSRKTAPGVTIVSQRPRFPTESS